MSEVKKSEPFVYWADCADPDQSAMCWHKEDALTQINDHGGTLYELSHTSDLDAKRLRADTAEAERDHAKEERDSFQRVGIQTMEKLTAAEQRISELVAAIETYLKGTGNSPGSNRRHAELRAALNPKPEAGSHEA